MHIAYLTTLIEELESRGLDARSLIDPVPAEVSPEHLARLLRRAVTLTGDPALGLDFGLRLNLASHGMLGYALMSSRNGQQLMDGLVRFSRLAIPSIELVQKVAGTQIRLVCRADVPNEDEHLYIEVVLGTLIAGARALFNRRIPGAQAWFSYPPPAHADRYKSLGIPVHFNAADSALVCDREFLALELPSANPAMLEIGQRQCYALLEGMKSRAGMAALVRRELVRSNGEFPNQQAIAGKLNTSARTVRRQLAIERTTFREILDEVRFELAKRYLETRELPITEIAALLGYDDPANFRRAFKRWSGVTAQMWQRRNSPPQ